ncbi:MAG: tRNA dihydrouridine synthase DusB [Armatimonadota bacterium]|nr:tRNA dihydrouridine synthase DusB [Armatimonadota bacterium]
MTERERAVGGAAREDALLKPISIGEVRVDPPLLLAPMAGFTNHPFRLLCREEGAGLVCTEFVSCHGLVRRMRNTWVLLDVRDDERPVSVQIFGADPAVMADAARLVQDAGADIVDINMGCWVPKVARTGAGAALMRSPDLAGAVVRAVVKAVSIPVTVKTRIGWSREAATCVEVARRAEDAGAQLVTVHARAATCGHEGPADWQYIAQVKQAVSIPVVGNGDVKTPEDAHRMFLQTGCDGVMIGRAALGDPWIFRRIRSFLATGDPGTPPAPHQRLATAARHVRMACEEAPEEVAVREMRAHLACYVKGFPGAGAFRERLMRATRRDEVLAILEEALQHAAEMA